MSCAPNRSRRWFVRWQQSHRQLRWAGARRRLLLFLALVVGVAAALPYILAKTPLRNVLLAAAVPADVLRVTVRDASLSWFHGPTLSGLEVQDADGKLLLAAERISEQRGPLELLKNSRDLGTIEIVRPTVYVQARPDGTNLEDVLQKLLAGFPGDAAGEVNATTSKPYTLDVHLVDGTVHIEDVATKRQWRILSLDAQYELRGSSLGLASIAGRISEINQLGGMEIPAGQFAVSLQPADAGRQQLTLQAESLALSTLAPWLRRFVPETELNGTLSGRGTAAWKATAFPVDLATSGALTVDRLDATAPTLVGDRLRLARVELPWRLSSESDGVAIEELQLRSEIVQAAIRGRLDPRLVAARHDLELRGTVDVARLAAMLPRALRIREDTTITAGTIEIAGRTQPGGGGQLITGSIRTSQLAATRAGRPLRWDEPVNANFAVRRTKDSTRIDTLRCDSKFLTIDAAGTPEQFSATASFDLNRLAEQLQQFVDLGGVQLAGTGTANLDWQQSAVDQFTAKAVADLAQLTVALREDAVWTEPQLALRAEASGLFDPVSHQPTQIDSAQLHVSGQGDVLDVRLTAAVGLAADRPIWPVAIRANGRIQRWLTRARPWFAPDPWQIDGQTELAANVRVAANLVEVSQTRLVVSNLRAAAPGWNINETRAELSGDARWDGATSELSATTAQLVTSTVSLAAKDIRYQANGQGIAQLTGAAAFRADLARLAAWQAPANEPIRYQPRGELTGNLRFVQQPDRISGELNATGQNLLLSSRAVTGFQTIWQEPKLTVRSVASYEPADDRLVFNELQIQSNTLQGSATGEIQKLISAADVTLNGTLTYYLAQVSPLLRPYLGTGIQLTGREQARFAVAGSLRDAGGPRAQLTGTTTSDPYSTRASTASASTAHWSRRVRAQFELPWSGANVYGLPVGAGRLGANLGDGALHIEPLNLTVGEGQLTTAPIVRFDPEPSELSLPAGPLFTNVRISPEVSEAMLKYVAPVLAGATRSEGHFSLQLDATRVPLAEPKRADSAGRLTVHSVRVVPGPLAQELITISQQVEALAKRRDPTALVNKPQATLLAIRDQQVSFRLLEGRVHHQNMEFQVGEVTLRSQGSVGLDETLALTLHIPIQDAWVSKEPLLAGLKGQSLQVPVSGTLTRPQLDRRAVTSLSGQLIQNAAGQAIGGELNKALDKLFKSR